MSLFHGGDLSWVLARYGGERDNWIDLSTGIAADGWPVPAVSATVWRCLPEADDGLVEVAATYYGCASDRLLPVPGSQHAISLLPGLWPQGVVALPYWAYQEHCRAWQKAGHLCQYYHGLDVLQRQLQVEEHLRYAVVINPNNPVGQRAQPGQLVALANILASRDGYLLLDEAFIDLYPDCSLVALNHPAIVVLRSVGKFFGLAGLRLGFVIAPPPVLAALTAATNPWAVSHPARWLGMLALSDTVWQAAQYSRLIEAGHRWLHLIEIILPAYHWRQAGLFVSALMPAPVAKAVQQEAACQHLWLRVYEPQEDIAVLRLGVPSVKLLDEAGLRLRKAVAGLSDSFVSGGD